MHVCDLLFFIVIYSVNETFFVNNDNKFIQFLEGHLAHIDIKCCWLHAY